MIRKQITGLSLQVPSSQKPPSSQTAFTQVAPSLLRERAHESGESDRVSVSERNYPTEAENVTGGEREATGRQQSATGKDSSCRPAPSQEPWVS